MTMRLEPGPVDDHTCGDTRRTGGRDCHCCKHNGHTGPHQCRHGWTWRTGLPVVMSDHCWQGDHQPCITPGCSCPCHQDTA